ncbi:MAG: SgcJ/EcaC family oxidoreductase [Polyangiales bacterium]
MPDPDSKLADREEQKAVHALLARYEAAFNSKRPDEINALFTEDASFVNFGGNLVRGREALHRAQSVVLGPGGPLEHARVRYTVESTVFLTPEVAVLHARQRSAGSAADQVETTRDPLHAIFVIVAQKRANGWLIRTGQNTPVL